MEAEAWFFSLLFLPEVSCKNNWSPISVVSVQIAVFDFSSEARTYCSITSGNVCECLTALNHRFRSTNDALDWFNVYVFFFVLFSPFSFSFSFFHQFCSLPLSFFFFQMNRRLGTFHECSALYWSHAEQYPWKS